MKTTRNDKHGITKRLNKVIPKCLFKRLQIGVQTKSKYMPVFRTTSTVVKRWKQPECPLVHKWINSMSIQWHVILSEKRSKVLITR